MFQIKIFSTIQLDNKYLEKDINDWLASMNDIDLVDIKISTTSYSSIVKTTCIVLYKNKPIQVSQEEVKN